MPIVILPLFCSLVHVPSLFENEVSVYPHSWLRQCLVKEKTDGNATSRTSDGREKIGRPPQTLTSHSPLHI
jgi:hypothetical protein